MAGETYESNGFTIELPNGYGVSRRTAAARGRGGRLPDGVIPLAPPNSAADPVTALLEQDFEVVGDRPTITADRTAYRSARVPHVTVRVAEDNHALVLVEQNGMFHWVAPTDPTGTITAAPPAATRSPTERRAATTKVLEFELPFAERGASAAERGLLDSVTHALARVTVLKFAAHAITDHLVEHLESHIDTRLVQITAPAPASWQTFTGTKLPRGAAAPRVLLFVHGTFSSTAGGFGSLAGTKEGLAFLRAALQQYDLVLGYDHRTLSVDPEQNALDLLSRLRAIHWPAPPVIDLVTHSRGALVARSFVETVLPPAKWACRVDKAVFVAGPNAGTQLANYENWPRLLDLYTTIAAAAAKLLPEKIAATVISGAIKGLGALAKAILTYALTEDGAPGIAAMNPTGSFVQLLNQTQPGQPAAGTTPWFVVESNFDAHLIGTGVAGLPAALRDWVLDKFADSLMREENDLVVNTASMAAIDQPVGVASGFVQDIFEFAPNDGVFHTIYFHQPRTATYLAGKLLDAVADVPVAGAPPPLPPLRERGVSGRFPTSMALPPGPDVALRHSAPRRGGVGAAAPARRGGGGVPARHGPTKRSGARTPAPARATAPITAFFRAAMPGTAGVGVVTTLTATIGRAALSPIASGETGGSAKAAVAADRKITVQVVPKANAEVVGADRVDVDLPADSTPLDLYFDVRPLAAGKGEIHVVARQGPVPLITLVLTPSFTRAAPKKPVPNVGAAAESIASSAPKTCVKQWLRITERSIGTSTVYDFELEADDLKLLCKATSDPLVGGREKYVAELYKRIENRWTSSKADVAAFSSELRSLGGELWDELIPAEFGTILWKHRKSLTNVLILSDEPFIPWELVHLKNGRTLPPQSWFLARLGSMRWLQGTYPPDVVHHAKVRYLAPDYPPNSGLHLDATAAEAAFLKKELGARALRADTSAVLAALAKPGTFDVLHFAGHGEADDTSAFILLQGRVDQGPDGPVYVTERLTDTTIGQQAQLQGKDGSQPMVVLNACQAGRLTPKLTHVGGFAHAFLQAGAGVFVSSLWSIGDEPALAFVETLYRNLLAGRTLAEASVAARAAAHTGAGDATWLAYVVYGNPCARFA